MKRVTIKDIAKIAGVSRGTVDRVINNRGNVSKKVEEDILTIAQKLGYEKNIMASRLASTKVFEIAIVCPNPNSDIFWELPKKGIESASNLVKYYGIKIDYYEFDLFKNDEFEFQLTKAIDAKPDAIILAPVFLKESINLLNYAAINGIPFITINSEINHDNILCYIGQNSYQSGYLAGKLFQLVLEPHDEIIVVNLAHKIKNAPHYTDKIAGLNNYLIDNNMNDNKVFKYECENFLNESELSMFFKMIQDNHSKMKGLFFTNSRAYRLLEILKDEEIASYQVVGYDMIKPNVKLINENKIDFLINQNPFQQGYEAIMTFVNHFINKKEISKKQYLHLDIVVKENVDFYN